MHRRIGVHISIAGGIDKGLQRASQLGCSAVQMFSHNPRGWKFCRRSSEEIERFQKLRFELSIFPVVIHTSYLINLASSNRGLFDKSVQMVIKEMDIADELGAEYVVIHTGSSSEEDSVTARRRAAEALSLIAKSGKWRAGLLLENTAGERGDITSRIEDIAELMGLVEPGLITGICFDTCHAFSAGYDIMKTSGIEKLGRDIIKYLGLDTIKLLHFNDSKRPLGAGVDRHEHIGEGTIGLKGLKQFLAHPLFRDLPLILETPKKSDEDDFRNIQKVRNLLISN